MPAPCTNGDTPVSFSVIFDIENGLDGELTEGSLSDTDFTLGAQAYSIDRGVCPAMSLPG